MDGVEGGYYGKRMICQQSRAMFDKNTANVSFVRPMIANC